MAAVEHLPALSPTLNAVVWLYLLTNAVRVFTYLPQIRAVWRDSEGARTLSLLTWGSWTLSNLCALAYALLVARDLPLALISAINLVGCGCVTAVAAQRRLQWRRRRAAAVPHAPAPCTTAFRRPGSLWRGRSAPACRGVRPPAAAGSAWTRGSRGRRPGTAATTARSA